MNRVISYDHNSLVSVAYFGREIGELTTADDVLYFFEKPWKYEEIFEAWYDRLEAEAS